MSPSCDGDHPLQVLLDGLLKSLFITLLLRLFTLLSSNDPQNTNTQSFDDVICAAGLSDYGRPKRGEAVLS